MEIVVCVKRVPDTAEAEVVIAPGAQGVQEQNLVFDINEADNYALESALQLKESLGGTVTVLTMGPDASDEVLRMCLAKGADRAVRLTDPKFAGSDAYAIARLLKQAIGGLTCNLVLTGCVASDDGYGQVGVALAELLGVPHAAMVKKLVVESDGAPAARVHRELEGGVEEVLDVALPAVFTIQTGINEPRYASIMGIRKAMKKPIDVQGADALGLADGEVGAAGSKTHLERLFVPPVEKTAEIITGSPAEAATRLTEILKGKGVI